jgi:hypothetical protein
MRFFEIMSGIRVPVTRHEQHIVDLFDDKPFLDESDLDQYQLELIRSLVQKDILLRKVTSNTITYSLNSDDDLWRL